MRVAFCLVLYLAITLTSCTVPRVILFSDPLNAREYNDLGVVYEASGETALALGAYESAFAKDRAWDQPLINHGNVHAALENWQKAEASYRRALKRNPHNPEAMNNLAYALMKQNNALEALEWSGKALDLEPGNALFKSTKALVFFELGEKVRALDLLEGALRDLPVDDPLLGEIMAIMDRIRASLPVE